MTPRGEADILENTLRKQGPLLDILLKDRTTGRNIIWATDSYVTTGKRDDPFLPKKPMRSELVTGKYGKLIQPRAVKSKEEQKRRTKDKAEVFTPLRIVDEMNKAVDWAGDRQVVDRDNWQDYVRELKLEITCSEAPFIVSRYDPTAYGVVKVLSKRVGFLDRKLRAVSEFCDNPTDWLKWALEAYKASYGYEWQGDNLLIARENLLYTLRDYYKAKFGRNPSLKIQLEFAEVISWNIWQMDGLKYVVPMSCRQTIQKPEAAPKNQLSLLPVEKPKPIKLECEGCRLNLPLAHTGKYAKIKDWSRGKNGVSIKFQDLLKC